MAEEKIYDLAIVGGGIAGAGIAWDASLRGMRVVLFEKNTFGSGTSSKSSKLIHGGLRYLETAWRALKRGDFRECLKNFHFVIVALHETQLLERIAPELIRPIELLLPIYHSSRRNPFAVYFGALLYGLLFFLTGGRRLPRILPNAKAVLARVPLLNPEGLAGGVLIWDHTTEDLELVRAVIRAAAEKGALALEHTEMISYQFLADRHLFEIEVLRDGGRQIFYSRALVNAAGPWADEIRRRGNEKEPDLIHPVAGSHITAGKFSPCSVILEAEDNRLFFVINRNGQSRVGTTERVHADPDCVEATEEEIEYLLRSVKKFFPQVSLTRKDIEGSDAAIRPLAKPPKEISATDISREHEIVTGPSGVIHVIGVKLTDFRRAAKEVVDRLAPDKKCRTHLTPLLG